MGRIYWWTSDFLCRYFTSETVSKSIGTVVFLQKTGQRRYSGVLLEEANRVGDRTDIIKAAEAAGRSGVQAVPLSGSRHAGRSLLAARIYRSFAGDRRERGRTLWFDVVNEEIFRGSRVEVGRKNVWGRGGKNSLI